ncbi:MAG: YqaE/Pmp3 family membrane protein [bacterium]|nr:YqaE/Pmp3 family membrane protein [bacterium]
MVNLLKIILAIFLPPIAAFLQVGFSLHLLINILLTVLGVLPGSIHALWLIVTNKA